MSSCWLLAAVSFDGSALEYASEELKKDVIVLAAEYASEELKNDDEKCCIF